MDQRILLLIDGVRHTHRPVWWKLGIGRLSSPLSPYCTGCIGLVIHSDCPVLAAAKELIDESNEPEESG